MTTVLVLGGGGREHALCWKLAQDPEVSRIVCAPGNGGIAQLADCVACDIEDPAAVVALARREGSGFVVIGPEAPLAAGVADALAEAGIAHFGPSRAAAMLEASKTFAKEIADAVGAPTARWRRFEALAPALDYVEAEGAPIVVKADGLAAGKGVTVAETVDAAISALEAMFATPGAAVVVEACMTGPEASLFALCDGAVAVEFGWAQDHKRAFDGDAGPNTGGMGAYSPAPVLTEALREAAMARIVRPAVAEMARRGTPYRGVLYAGLMLTAEGPKLVEFNARFGDPECQALMMRLASPLLPLLRACAEGALACAAPQWREAAAATVVMAAKGYPGPYARGERIGGLEAAAGLPGVQVFHAGTAARDGAIVSNGGRVLNVCALGADLPEAVSRAYAGVGAVDWPGGFHRRDIGVRALG
ncbi:MAG: phosphoribosylamine--glycine ligase [Pseudomonadota bacterium]